MGIKNIAWKEFEIYKFRSMRTDYDKEGRGIQTKGSSSAITPIGKIIRKTKLDELPQFFNIIKGGYVFCWAKTRTAKKTQIL